MPIFDFHCHPSMKTQFAAAGKEPNPWDKITVELTVLNDIRIKINPFFSDSLDSQSCLRQLHAAKVNLIGLILYAPESNIAKGLLSKSIVSKGHIKQLDPNKLKVINNGEAYFKLINTEIEFLLAKSKAPDRLGLPSGTKFKLISSMSEYNRSDTNTIHGFLIIEGLHGFFNKSNATTRKEDFFKNLKTFTDQYRVFAVNVTHLQDMPLANHASGIQFLNDEDFYPTGNGITGLGKEIIEKLYKQNILIDLKHMGLWSRMNLYGLRSDSNIQMPLICTHAGITGVSIHDKLKYLYAKPQNLGNVWRVQYYKKWGRVPHAVFNLSSINLYDEDIVQILGSAGLIGISLDQRILGFPADNITFQLNGFPCDEEFISMKEKDVFFGANRNPLNFPLHEADETLVMNGDAVLDQIDKGLEEIHAYYFWNQVIHILFVAKQNTSKGLSVADACNRICLGSDFDGLINPIDCCENATAFPDFKSKLLRIANSKEFWTNSGFTQGEIDVPSLLENIFFNNAERFLNLNFN